MAKNPFAEHASTPKLSASHEQIIEMLADEGGALSRLGLKTYQVCPKGQRASYRSCTWADQLIPVGSQIFWHTETSESDAGWGNVQTKVRYQQQGAGTATPVAPKTPKAPEAPEAEAPATPS